MLLGAGSNPALPSTLVLKKVKISSDGRNEKQIMNNEIALDQARKILEVVDAGLCSGLGEPVLGQMCVEAAVCYALGQPHGDEPACVNASVHSFQISLNDCRWASNESRAKGMRRLAIAQLGTSEESFNERKFLQVLVEQTIRKIVPHALRLAITGAEDACDRRMEEAAVRCERDGDLASADNADATARSACSAAAYAAYDPTYAADAAADAAYAARVAADVADAAADAARGAAYAADVAAAAAHAARCNGDDALNLSAEIGVEALRAAGAHGIALMDQLIP